jgi:peptidoglycan/LPS O-acetylase OafA/YrhL
LERLGYRRALDGLRALAITTVVCFHTFGIPAGGVRGVDLFFVLSGFLITTLLLEEHGRHGRVRLRAFFRRRALRLVPAVVVMLAV